MSKIRARDGLCLTAILLLAFALRVAYLTVDRFHADEALYAGWALDILEGDPLLRDAPVDKPPLYLYTLAGTFALLGHSEVAARFPNLSASLLGIVFVYRLACRLYRPAVGTWAALFLALSPFDVLFARTAFTDSMLVVWTLAALCAIVDRRWFNAGLLLGLAFATKQHAILLIPLVLAVGLVRLAQDSKSTGWLQTGVLLLLRVGLGFLLPFLGVMAWDAARWAGRPGYWQQSAMSYGGLVWSAPSTWGERGLEWLSWARYLLGSPLLAVLAVIGCVLLVLLGWWYHPRHTETWFDTLWLAYLLVYLLAHTLPRFSIWDRYLLPLAPLVSLLLARVVDALCTTTWPGRSASSTFRSRLHYLVNLGRVPLASFLLILALFAGYQAARNGYPVGGEHWAYQGLDEITSYLLENAPPNAVLYHHWLRWHYTYYLHNATFELRWWESGEHLQREALRTPERAQYIVLPDWRTLEPDAPALRFELLYQARRQDGSVSLSLYQIFPQAVGHLGTRMLYT